MLENDYQPDQDLPNLRMTPAIFEIQRDEQDLVGLLSDEVIVVQLKDRFRIAERDGDGTFADLFDREMPLDCE